MNIPIAICLCLLSSTGVFSKNVRIIGGAPGLISDFPFMVSIRTFQTNQLVCGGSIISRWNILTAAHCLYVFDNDYTDVRVYSGTASSIEMYGFSYQIDHVYFHPQFNFLNLNGVYLHDISVVKLRTAIQFDAFQEKISLPSRPSDTEHMVLITGWGMFENPSNSLASPTLRVAMGMILDNYDCSSRVQYTIAEHQLCTIDTYGTGVCINDGGGSIVSNGVIYGIISYSLNNVGGFPDVHTKVYFYLDFIRNHMTE